MKYIITISIVLIYWNAIRITRLERRAEAAEAALASHREDAKTAVGKVYEDINRVRFTQAALANTLRFVAPKEAEK